MCNYILVQMVYDQFSYQWSVASWISPDNVLLWRLHWNSSHWVTGVFWPLLSSATRAPKTEHLFVSIGRLEYHAVFTLLGAPSWMWWFSKFSAFKINFRSGHINLLYPRTQPTKCAIAGIPMDEVNLNAPSQTKAGSIHLIALIIVTDV